MPRPQIETIRAQEIEERPAGAPFAGGCERRLSTDAETGDWTWLAAGVPNRVTPLAEIHLMVEEAFLIRGDVLVGTRGEMGPGIYFWRPGIIEHGPLASRNGTLFFFRTKLGGLDLETVETPGWQELVREYRARQPYYRG